ncbi:MAG: M3 family oligoendopeptidase, partial [Sediminibacterium sp.]|nr:M3 family oligoendopeptidase [Sediminibacterium sp.]
MNLNFNATEIKISTWENIEPFFTNLYNRSINNVNELLQWLTDRSNVESAISEDACWRQINVTRNTLDTNYQNAFQYFCTNIQPNVEKWIHILNQKLI